MLIRILLTVHILPKKRNIKQPTTWNEPKKIACLKRPLGFDALYPPIRKMYRIRGFLLVGLVTRSQSRYSFAPLKTKSQLAIPKASSLLDLRSCLVFIRWTPPFRSPSPCQTVLGLIPSILLLSDRNHQSRWIRSHSQRNWTSNCGSVVQWYFLGVLLLLLSSWSLKSVECACRSVWGGNEGVSFYAPFRNTFLT